MSQPSMQQQLVRSIEAGDAAALCACLSTLVKSAKDLNAVVNSLKPDGCAVFAVSGHVGVIRPGYKDPHIEKMLPADVWTLPAPQPAKAQPPPDGGRRP